MGAPGFLTGVPLRRRGLGQGQTIQLTPEQIQKLIESQGAGGGGLVQVPQQAPQLGPVESLIRHGAIVMMTVSMPESAAEALRAQGQEPPAPQKVRMLVDTGASISGVKDEFAQAAGLTATDSVQIGGVVGAETRAIYAARLYLDDDHMAFDPIQIAGIPLPGQTEIDGLLGRDFLARANLVYHGNTGNFDITPPPGEAKADLWSMAGAGALGLAAMGSLYWLGRGSR
jgi:hypothetical protein